MWSFIIFFGYIIGIFFVNSYLLLFISFLINIFVMCMAKINIRKVFNNLLGILLFTLITFIINLFVLSLEDALMVSVKIILVCNITYIFSKILTPLKMVEALEKILSPVNAVGVQSRDIGILICIFMAFIPIFMEEMKQVLYAMKAKCINVGVKNLYLIISPMIMSSLKRTKDIEMALKAKAYE